MSQTFESPFYPIVYVRGYAMRRSDMAETFYDTYYGFAASAVYKKQTSKNDGCLAPDLFEGQLIRFMKKYNYADSVNTLKDDFNINDSKSGLNPFQTIWVSRFYDLDFIQDKVRTIEYHARELADLIINKIPQRLSDLGANENDLKNKYKVILIAHSMGGLVCRTLIQNILPLQDYKRENALLPQDHLDNPDKLIHRLITIGTPHKGIDLGNIPDFIENALTATLNPFDSNMFKPRRMREYLKLENKIPGKENKNDEDSYQYDLHSLGNSKFPVKKCLCIIGSDYHSYSSVQYVTGSFSDGLVKQDRAYIVGGPKPSNNIYAEDNVAFYANVHRAHSGFHGIVNSYESFENIQRFLFGNLKVRISLTELLFKGKKDDNCDYNYDFEFSLSIQGTGIYLHQRQQENCENAIRYNLRGNNTRFRYSLTYRVFKFKIAAFK